MKVSYKKLWKILIDQDMKKRDLEKAAGISHYTINKSAIADMVIPIPSLEEQKRVAYLLSIYDDRIAKEEQLLSELEAMRKGLLQQLFI